MARKPQLFAISNPLVTPQQLLAFQEACKIPSENENLLFRIGMLTQTAGTLLRLPQEVIAASIIILQRYLIQQPDIIPSTGGEHDEFSIVSPRVKASMAAVYAVAKQSFYPLSPRSVINVYTLLNSKSDSPLSFVNPTAEHSITLRQLTDPQSFFVSEGTFQMYRDMLFEEEQHLLAALNFDLQVILPYNLALTYLQALSASSPDLSEKVIAYLNSALLSPQLLYITHQPNALAVAALYIAAREQNVALVDDQVPWWEVFDVGREELGFLVLSLGSLRSYADAQKD